MCTVHAAYKCQHVFKNVAVYSIYSIYHRSFMFICLILVAGGSNHANFHQLGLSLWGEVAAPSHQIATGPPDSLPAVSECVQRCWEEVATPKWCHLWPLEWQCSKA